jgi:hypothetical protein
MWIFRKTALDKIKPLEDFNDGMPFSFKKLIRVQKPDLSTPSGL